MSDVRSMTVSVTVSVFALHRWDGASGRRSYLGAPHGHNFGITGEARVSHADREIEFHDLRESLLASARALCGADVVRGAGAQWVDSTVPSFGGMSCEGIAHSLLDAMPELIRVTVSEDDTVRATVSRADSALASAGPQVVTVCGSTRFRSEMESAVESLTLEGHIVLAVGVYHRSVGGEIPTGVKRALDELHLRKIDASDFVYVVCPGGYIGESTRAEIEHARARGLPVVYSEPVER